MGCRWLLFRYTRIYFYYKFFSGLSSVTLLTLCYVLSLGHGYSVFHPVDKGI